MQKIEQEGDSNLSATKNGDALSNASEPPSTAGAANQTTTGTKSLEAPTLGVQNQNKKLGGKPIQTHRRNPSAVSEDGSISGRRKYIPKLLQPPKHHHYHHHRQASDDRSQNSVALQHSQANGGGAGKLVS